MAVTPSMAQIAGAHLSTYEALFQQVDTNGSGIISALDAATFLKKSGLSVGVLSQVWESADSAGRGVLDRPGVFVALKLIALAQNGKEMSLVNLALQIPPPSMGTPASPAIVPLGTEGDGWAIAVTERAKYDHIFEGLQPINGMLTGDKVRPVLLNSGLPVDVLGRVWDLSDIDEDGFLDREEFAVAMHLVYKALEKQPVPLKLPPNVIPPSKRRKTSVIPGAIRVLPPIGLIASPPSSATVSVSSPPPIGIGRGSPTAPASVAVPPGGAPAIGWVVTPVEKAKFEEMFIQIDTDMDGLVNGIELREIFLQSGLNQAVLAHIWTLCDTRGVGQLNLEQFCLAMYLVQLKLTGVDPPQTLPANMVPPSMRGPGLVKSEGPNIAFIFRSYPASSH
ncbi:Epidermal growth factor receptor substrate 15-like 1 [Lamellibrachia satsuma]|nr:Epidermal growth factor receptor substrate 15-like 1 [Lamellibrachia satsuma]